MPRTTRLTPALTAAIIALVETGADPGSAGEARGISRATVNEWIRRGEGRDDREGGEPYATFATEVRAAEARAEQDAVAQVQQAVNGGNWRAACWLLERRFPERWGRRQAIAHGITASRHPAMLQGDEARERATLTLQGLHALMSGEK